MKPFKNKTKPLFGIRIN